MSIRFKKATLTRRYKGFFEYLISYDYEAAMKNRYTVLILIGSEATIIGRELRLPIVRILIEEYEREANLFVANPPPKYSNKPIWMADVLRRILKTIRWGYGK